MIRLTLIRSGMFLVTPLPFLQMLVLLLVIQVSIHKHMLASTLHPY